MRIVERHFVQRPGTDETYFLRLFGRARRFHKHGKSLDTVAELAECISKAFWEYNKGMRVAQADMSRARFYTEACKVRCMVDDHGATVGGYIVLHGELKALWCDIPGHGAWLIQQALNEGADHLNCFDGPLVGLYSQFGFEVTARVANLTSGGPDVVYMELP